MNKCRCCSEVLKNQLFFAKLLKENVAYFECNNCGYVQTEEPYWLKDAYLSAINNSDTGIMMRNLSNISLVLGTLAMMSSRSALIVDYAGGHGFLVRLLRDIGINALWSDPYCKNLVARGFEYNNENEVKLLTAFETFEHFLNPCDEMTKMLKISSNILFTTNIIPDPAPGTSEWWYYGLEHGQHIGFYRLKTLKYIANKYDLYLMSDGEGRHLFSKYKYFYYTWRILIKLADKFPKILRMGMRSKTWEDHLFISKNKNNFNL
jgi:hypothetical protein